MAEISNIEEVHETKQKFYASYKDKIGQGVYDQRDLDRLNSDDVLIRCYLRHNKGNVEKTAAMIHTSFQWRKDLGINDLKDDSFPRSVHECGGIYYHGEDKDGHFILNIRMSKHKRDPGYTEMVKKHFAWLLEKQFAKQPEQRIVVLIDMTGAGLSNVDINFLKFQIACFTTYFPAFLHYMLIYEMPWILNAIWNLVKKLLDAEQQRSVLLVKKPEMTKYLEKDQLPLHMGGTDDYQYSYIPSEDSGLEVDHQESDLEMSLTSSDEFQSWSTLRKRVVSNIPRSVSFDNCSVDRIISEASKFSINGIIRGSIANISPPEKLIFPLADGNKDSTSVISITSNGLSRLAFKVKITSTDAFRVKPIKGFIEPGETGNVIVSLLAGHRCTPNKDRFLVMLIAINDDISSTNTSELNSLWKSTPKDSVNYMEHRLMCENEKSMEPAQSGRNSMQKLQANKYNESDLMSQFDDLRKKQEDLSEKFESSLQMQKLTLSALLVIVLLLIVLWLK